MAKRKRLMSNIGHLWRAIPVVLLTLTISACSSDDGNEAIDFDEDYQISYYDAPPYAKYSQGYWYTEEKGDKIFNKMTPNTQAPYWLLVIPIGEKGKETMDRLAEKKSSFIKDIQEVENGRYFITSSKYFESPYLYVSDNYDVGEISYRGYPIHVIPKMIIHLKAGSDISAIEEKYGGVLMNKVKKEWEKGNPELTFYNFDCSVRNSYEILKLSEEIFHLEEVEWAEPDMYGTYSTALYQ